MADGFGLREKLDARIASARRSLLWPALIRAILPALVWFTVFVVFWLSGLYTALPLEAQATVGVVFWLGIVTSALIGWKVWRAPSDDEARDLIDSAIEGRPLSVWTDRPARPDTTGWTLWQEHRDRMAALAAKVGKLDVRPHWKQADPLYLRLAAPALIIIAGVYANVAAPDRLYRGLFPDFGALFGAHTLKIEAWITPPVYTGSAPFVLTSGEPAKAPEGSEVTLRVIGPGAPQIIVMPVDGGAVTLHPQADIENAYEARVVVKEPMTIAVNYWGTRASFPFTVTDDASPTVSFVEPPKLGEGDRTEFKYKIADDYGVDKLELVFFGRKDVPASAGVIEDAVIVDTVALSPTEEEGNYSQDLVRHRWAGMDLQVKLRATDAAGQTAESEAVAYRLPEKIFLQPNARMAQEARAVLLRNWEDYKMPEGGDNFTSVAGTGYNALAVEQASRLRWAPKEIKRSVMLLDAITWRPEDYFQDPVIFMGLRNAHAIIDSARDREEAESAEGLLWDIALRAEYGSLADASAALEAARRALEEALRRGASEEEIKRLMDMYEQAIENYLAAKMAEALRNGNVTADNGQQQGGGQPGQQMGDDELTRMLQALRDLAETGARDQARQLLSDMQKLMEKMENMQVQMGRNGGSQGQQQDGPMNRAMNRALQDTNRAMNDQRDLNDATDEAARDGASPQKGQELADQQRQLRERLEQQMRSGGGQPQQPEQQQGQGPGGQQQGQQQPGQGQPGQQQGQQGQQQGQGQQDGQGQQQGQGPGQQQGQNGQGSQGSQPGQQPGQQQGQGQGQGQQADRGGPGGQPGRPGAQGDGRYGQETERTRRLLGSAIEMQKRAEDALRRGDFAAAKEAQQQAMSALADRSSELARLNDENDPEAREERDQRDILGRLNNGESGYGDNVQIPEEMDRQKAREILDEIRRRAGNRALTREELEYLNRLLERF